GIHRLKLLKRLAPHVDGLYVWAVDDEAPSFWVADLGAARVTMGLSSRANEGFSGDGEALFSARRPVEAEVVERARSLAEGMERFNIAQLSARLRVSESVTAEVVDLLSEQGLLGLDLAAGVFFPRHLPYVTQGFAVQERDRHSRRLAGDGRALMEQRE